MDTERLMSIKSLFQKKVQKKMNIHLRVGAWADPEMIMQRTIEILFYMKVDEYSQSEIKF